YSSPDTACATPRPATSPPRPPRRRSTSPRSPTTRSRRTSPPGSRCTWRAPSRSTASGGRSLPRSRATTTTWWGSVSLWSAACWRNWAAAGPTSGQPRRLADRPAVQQLDLGQVIDVPGLVVDLHDADRPLEHEGPEQREPRPQPQHQTDHVGRDVV